ncbi:MAG: hypothetical protein PHX78_00170 [bacterium]|nr:hypothetical protein [bacterium]
MKKKNLLYPLIILLCFMVLPHEKSFAYSICEYWGFIPPAQNPIVPDPNFLGYWFPPENNPTEPFSAGGQDNQFSTDATHPKGPYFVGDSTGATHDGIDLFAWLEKVGDSCIIHFFNTTNVVKPTSGGLVKEDTFKKGPDGVAEIMHKPKPMNTYEKYAHVEFTINGGNVDTSTSLGTLSDSTSTTYVHLHYSVYIDGEAKNPLNYMQKSYATCGVLTPEPAACILLGSLFSGLFISSGYFKRRSKR